MTQLAMFEPPPEGHQFTDPEKLKEFILSGKAIFTLYSEKSTKHVTYKVIAKGGFKHWVTYRTSNDAWEYLGQIREDRWFNHTAATRMAVLASYRFKAFDWLWKQLMANRMPPQARVYHEGRCGACGRPLTDPTSISTGFGPDCREKLFKRPAVSDKVQS